MSEKDISRDVVETSINVDFVLSKLDVKKECT